VHYWCELRVMAGGMRIWVVGYWDYLGGWHCLGQCV
jgi:hypothetical protein